MGQIVGQAESNAEAPQTAAGQELHQHLWEVHQAGYIGGTTWERVDRGILAIEAEARADTPAEALEPFSFVRDTDGVLVQDNRHKIGHWLPSWAYHAICQAEAEARSTPTDVDVAVRRDRAAVREALLDIYETDMDEDSDPVSLLDAAFAASPIAFTPAETLDVERTIAQAIRDNWGDSPEPIWTPEEMAAFIAARLSSVREPTDD